MGYRSTTDGDGESWVVGLLPVEMKSGGDGDGENYVEGFDGEKMGDKRKR